MFKENGRMVHFQQSQSDDGVKPYRNKEYSPKAIIAHVKIKANCICHFVILCYLNILYCNDEILRTCVCNNVVLPNPDRQYVELMNW